VNPEKGSFSFSFSALLKKKKEKRKRINLFFFPFFLQQSKKIISNTPFSRKNYAINVSQITHTTGPRLYILLYIYYPRKNVYSLKGSCLNPFFFVFPIFACVTWKDREERKQ